jgi:hypothetical protein
LVVSVDTSVAQLTDALAKSVWVLLTYVPPCSPCCFGVSTLLVADNTKQMLRIKMIGLGF